jgi:hypothetical protein
VLASVRGRRENGQIMAQHVRLYRTCLYHGTAGSRTLNAELWYGWRRGLYFSGFPPGPRCHVARPVISISPFPPTAG